MQGGAGAGRAAGHHVPSRAITMGLGTAYLPEKLSAAKRNEVYEKSEQESYFHSDLRDFLFF